MIACLKFIPGRVLLLGVMLVATGLRAASISAGMAVVDITPPLGGQRLGYGNPVPTDGINHPITARVLVLRSGDTTLALVTWDLCVANSPWLHAQMAGLGIDRLLLMNTHTHSGPNLDEAGFPSRAEPLRPTVERKVLVAIKEAKANLSPAYFAAGTGSIQLGYNRLVRQPEGHAITHFDNPERIPYGPVDPTVSVLRVTDESGKVRAVLVNYACHPVVLGPANRKWSADYPGALRQKIESQLGDGAVCFFLQGAAGEINPLDLARTGDPEEDLPLVDTVGQALAGEVLSVLARMESIPGKSEQLAIASKSISLAHRWDAAKTQSTTVTTVLLNADIGFVAMAGEPFQQFQIDWRRKSGLPHTFFLGYCSSSDDPWTGYMPDIESAAQGGYGASDGTYVAVGTGERLLNEGLIQLFTLQGRLRDKPQRHLND